MIDEGDQWIFVHVVRTAALLSEEEEEEEVSGYNTELTSYKLNSLHAANS